MLLILALNVAGLWAARDPMDSDTQKEKIKRLVTTDGGSFVSLEEAEEESVSDAQASEDEGNLEAYPQEDTQDVFSDKEDEMYDKDEAHTLPESVFAEKVPAKAPRVKPVAKVSSDGGKRKAHKHKSHTGHKGHKQKQSSKAEVGGAVAAAEAAEALAFQVPDRPAAGPPKPQPQLMVSSVPEAPTVTAATAGAQAAADPEESANHQDTREMVDATDQLAKMAQAFKGAYEQKEAAVKELAAAKEADVKATKDAAAKVFAAEEAGKAEKAAKILVDKAAKKAAELASAAANLEAQLQKHVEHASTAVREVQKDIASEPATPANNQEEMELMKRRATKVHGLSAHKHEAKLMATGRDAKATRVHADPRAQDTLADQSIADLSLPFP